MYSLSFCKGSGRMIVDTLASHAVGHNAARFTGIACEAALGVMRYEMNIQRQRDAARGESTTTPTTSNISLSNHDTAGPLLIDRTTKLTQEMLRCCWPAVAGFSFTSKTWGVLFINGLHPIQFRDNAFDRIVLPPVSHCVSFSPQSAYTCLSLNTKC